MRSTMATNPKLNPLLRAEHISGLFRPPEPLANSLRCGFASTAGGNLIPIKEEKAKLRLVLEVARKAWT
jgi:hypothetical protein